MMTTRHHLELLPLDMDMPTRWKSNAISNAVTGRTKANQRHRFNRPRRPWQANATSHSASEGFAIRWREHVRTSTIYQAHDPLPPRHDPLIPSSCDIRFLGSTHERRKMTERQRTCLTLRIGYASARYQLLMHVLEPSRKSAVPAYIYTSIHQTPALELHLANTYPSDQSGTCSHLLESLHPGRYRALPFMQNARSPYPLPFL